MSEPASASTAAVASSRLNGSSSDLELANQIEIDGHPRTEPQVRGRAEPSRTGRATFDIFEGAEQIQQLVIGRAISGLRIE